ALGDAQLGIARSLEHLDPIPDFAQQEHVVGIDALLLHAGRRDPDALGVADRDATAGPADPSQRVELPTQLADQRWCRPVARRDALAVGGGSEHRRAGRIYRSAGPTTPLPVRKLARIRRFSRVSSGCYAGSVRGKEILFQLALAVLGASLGCRPATEPSGNQQPAPQSKSSADPDRGPKVEPVAAEPATEDPERADKLADLDDMCKALDHDYVDGTLSDYYGDVQPRTAW